MEMKCVDTLYSLYEFDNENHYHLQRGVIRMQKMIKKQGTEGKGYTAHKSRLLMVWMLALVLVLTACGAGAGTNANKGAQQPEADPSKSNSTTQTDSAFPVTIKHMKGEYTLTEKPKVIAVLDVKFVDQLVALGEQPAGSVVSGTKDETFPEYLKDKLVDVKVLGTRDEPNLEAIVALKPDLIIMTDFQEKIYDSVSKIADTIVLDFYEDWRDTAVTMGKITGKTTEAEALVKNYEDKIVGLRSKLSAELGDDTVSLIRPRKEGIRVHGPDHRTGGILYKDLGLKAPKFVTDIKEDTSVEVTMEKVPDIGADRYFLLSDAMFATETEQLTSSPIWQSIDAVKNNHVYNVDTQLWIAYYGPIAVNMIVDQAAEALLGSN